MTAHLPIARDPRLWTSDQFHRFLETRPDGERWQLVDGCPQMMAPPARWHQKVAKNLMWLLDDAIAVTRPDLETYFEPGAQTGERDDFTPQPDLLVIRQDEDFVRYLPRFFLVAEIISPSDAAEMIERKLELYQSHPDNLYCLAIDQDSVHVRLHAREDSWARRDLTALDDLLVLPAFGFSATLAAIYAGTPLAR